MKQPLFFPLETPINQNMSWNRISRVKESFCSHLSQSVSQRVSKQCWWKMLHWQYWLSVAWPSCQSAVRQTRYVCQTTYFIPLHSVKSMFFYVLKWNLSACKCTEHQSYGAQTAQGSVVASSVGKDFPAYVPLSLPFYTTKYINRQTHMKK